MTLSIDLHIHSRNSDGADTVEELVPLIAKAGVDVFALSDHDRTDGWQAARALATEFGLSFIPAIEITTEGRFSDKPRGIHLLAYLPDPNHPELQEVLIANQNSRITRMKKFVDKMQPDFPGLTFENVMAGLEEGATVGRPALAQALVELGVASKVGDVFDSGLIGRSSKYYVRNESPDVLDAIRIVRDAGGVPVIAHPLSRTQSDDTRQTHFPEADFEAMVEAGLLGLETSHKEVPAENKLILDAFARKHNLITTGSSDYHGLSVKENNPLGLFTTEEDQLKRILELGTGSKPLLQHSI
jgi:predicted metal-dependent phosphoesterase TrpH